jgi:DNA-binding NtrC family response regulator
MARILIVDDEPKLGRVLVEMLEGAGHDVGGAAAIQRMATGDLDLVVSDLRMPDVDGMAVLREVRCASPGTDVVLMTAHATAQNAVEAMKLGAADSSATSWRAARSPRAPMPVPGGSTPATALAASSPSPR